MVLPVRARRVYRDTALLVVRHPDGSLGHIPEWMTKPEAIAFSLRDRVVIPVRNLRDLRSTLVQRFVLLLWHVHRWLHWRVLHRRRWSHLSVNIPPIDASSSPLAP